MTDAVKELIEAAQEVLRGKITCEELAAARAAAWAAAGDAEKNRQQSIFVSYLLESEGAE
jgi:hypothetical protein